jgi:cell division protein ZapA
LKHAVQVTILGQQYTIRSGVAPEEIHRVAEFVNEKLTDIMAGSRSVDSLNTAVLALLHISQAYLRLREVHEEQAGIAAMRLARLLERLEGACAGGPGTSEKKRDAGDIFFAE